MAKADIFEQLEIRLPTQTYSVFIGSHLLSDPRLFEAFKPVHQALIVTNETIAPLYLERVQNLLASYQTDSIVLPDGEHFKNQDSLEKIYQVLLRHHHHRDTILFALGGGVIGDITGFAAATYQRGVRFVQLPTTLLAQVDASIGGKTAINHPLGKNMIGSFYQPQGVFIDLNTLSTLPKREFRAGFGEVIKYGLLAGGSVYEEMIVLLQAGEGRLDHEALATLIINCCKIKAQIVIEDEKEQGRRALLNLGHTFAHALEACTQYQRFYHGEAVAIGLYCAALLSHQLGILERYEVERLDQLIASCGLPRRIPEDIIHDQMIGFIRQDKKVMNQKMRFVVFSEPGHCSLEERVTEIQVRQVLKRATDKNETI